MKSAGPVDAGRKRKQELLKSAAGEISREFVPRANGSISVQITLQNIVPSTKSSLHQKVPAYSEI